MKDLLRTVSVAPMLDWTDRHERYFLRCISKRALLYSEMITTGAVLHGDKQHLLAFSPQEHPVALQLGGSDPHALAESAKIAEQFGYDEINLNVGCPSDRVQAGRFGACLMAEPDRVAECVAAMSDVVSIPVTIKCRIGIDHHDSFEFLYDFINTLSPVCNVFIIHARTAWLQGLSPKQNREVPPLDYPKVYRIKAAFPDKHISINGGIKDLDSVAQQLQQVDGVMIGREAYQNPYVLADVDRRFYDHKSEMVDRFRVVEQMTAYATEELSRGTALNHITRHILGLFNGLPGARLWRRHLSDNAHKKEANAGLIEAAANKVKALSR